MVPCLGFNTGLSSLSTENYTGNICRSCDSDDQCLGYAYLGYCNPIMLTDVNLTIANTETYNQCLIRTFLGSGSHLISRQGKCQVRFKKNLEL